LPHLAAGLACLFIALPSGALGAEVPHDAQVIWDWSGRAAPGASLSIDLVRANVVTTPSAGDQIRVRVFAEPDGDLPMMTLSRQGTGWRIIDVYPAARPIDGYRECHPAQSEHGAFWRSRSRLRVELSVPRGIRVGTHVIEAPAG
jgi:hypothetical protein